MKLPYAKELKFLLELTVSTLEKQRKTLSKVLLHCATCFLTQLSLRDGTIIKVPAKTCTYVASMSNSFFQKILVSLGKYFRERAFCLALNVANV